MSFDIPATMEPEIIRFAQTEHITEAEAIVRLIELGLQTRVIEDARIQALLGEPMSAEDAALMDEVVDMAMRARTVRWEPKPGGVLHRGVGL